MSLKQKQQHLAAGEWFFGQGDGYVRTLLGSCVAITLWHGPLRLGGMSHCLLPEAPAHAHQLDALYVHGAIGQFRAAMLRYGVRPEQCIAKLFGGGNMFPQHGSATAGDVGRRNVETARFLLRKEGFVINREHVGGHCHRAVVLDLSTGDTWLRACKPGEEA